MRPRPSPSYTLTPQLLASAVGTGVYCLAVEALGRTFRLHARRPDARLNRRVGPRTDLPSGAAHIIAPVASTPSLIRVDIVGPLEQQAGFHEICGGWTDGHDAVAERLCAAFVEGDVLLVVNSPGGAAAGLQQGIAKALAAKVKHGRRVTVWANEMIGSAAEWWAAALGDEVYLPVAGQIGSIGARGEHLDVSGALAKEGIVKTYFADPPDKVALAAEFPLTKAGEERGRRDVKIVADAFRAAVCSSPIGLRYKLTPDALIALGADVLTGQAAVAAGLADGVASEDEVTAYALKMAERASSTRAGAHVRARGDSTTMTNLTDQSVRARAGDDPPPAEAPAAGAEPTGACTSCGMQNEVNAKFCDQCGSSLAAMPLDEEEAQHDAPPPSSKPIPPGVASGASLAEALGLAPGASLPAQKSAAIAHREVFEAAAKLTGQRTAAGIIGGLTAISADAANGKRLREERDELRAQNEKRERWALAHKLVALGVAGHERARVFVDVVSDDGKRTSVKLAPMYADMKLDHLRGLVAGYERNAPKRDPFEPDRAAAASASKGAQHGDTAARIERAKSHPLVLSMARRPGQSVSIDQLAAAFVAQNFDLQPGA